jgi:uncharacterized protein
VNRLALLTLLICSETLGTNCIAAEPGTQPAPNTEPTPVHAQINAPDLAYGAFQRGYYLTAFQEAMNRLKANPNDAVAMTLIGELYHQGLGVRLDYAEAAHWYALAADRGNREAIFALASAKLIGEGIPKDRPGAATLFAKAAAMNHAGALYNLGVLAVENNGVVPEFAKAADYFRRSAELGYPDAAYALALCYRNAKGVPQDDKLAADWMKRAAADDDVPAEVEYAIMLFNGVGVEKDEEAAAKLFLKAATQQNPVAQNRVARLYAVGRGIRKDLVEAMKWHLIARAAGEKDEWLDGILNTLTPEQRVAVETAIRQYNGALSTQ